MVSVFWAPAVYQTLWQATDTEAGPVVFAIKTSATYVGGRLRGGEILSAQGSTGRCGRHPGWELEGELEGTLDASHLTWGLMPWVGSSSWNYRLISPNRLQQKFLLKKNMYSTRREHWDTHSSETTRPDPEPGQPGDARLRAECVLEATGPCGPEIGGRNDLRRV